MRYVVAIIFAILGALATMQFLASPVADWVALQPKFESSDDAETVNQLAFMVVNVLGLVLGWIVGWIVAGPLSRRQGTG